MSFTLTSRMNATAVRLEVSYSLDNLSYRSIHATVRSKTHLLGMTSSQRRRPDSLRVPIAECSQRACSVTRTERAARPLVNGSWRRGPASKPSPCVWPPRRPWTLLPSLLQLAIRPRQASQFIRPVGTTSPKRRSIRPICNRSSSIWRCIQLQHLFRV